MSKHLLFVLIVLILVFSTQTANTKSTNIRTPNLIGFDYEYKSAGRTYHLGYVVIDIIIIISMFCYFSRKLFVNSFDDFIFKQNARIVYIVYNYCVGTGMNLQNIFNQIDFEDYGILAVQFGSQFKRAVPGIKKDKNASASCVVLTVKTSHCGFLNDKLALAKIKIFQNGQINFNMKKHDVFAHVNNQLLKFLEDNNGQRNFYKGKISVKDFTIRYLYRIQLDHNIDLKCITKFNDNLLSNGEYKKIYCDNYPGGDTVVSKFNFTGTSTAYAKFHKNGNIYIYANYFAHFDKHRNHMKKIFGLVKKFLSYD